MVCDKAKVEHLYWQASVLILILLEYGLRRQQTILHSWTLLRLNPYSIGIWSATMAKSSARTMCAMVLILILLEYGLRHEEKDKYTAYFYGVLILILLEYGLRRLRNRNKGLIAWSLNPYSIGIWSATLTYIPLDQNSTLS